MTDYNTGLFRPKPLSRQALLAADYPQKEARLQPPVPLTSGLLQADGTFSGDIMTGYEWGDEYKGMTFYLREGI
jgi:hypothetical protein